MMGIITSRFQKKKTTIEILEDLETQIKEIQEYGQTTEQKHKKIVGTILLYGIVLYILTVFIYYSCFFPALFYDQIFYAIPLLFFPILLFLIKKMISWYYVRKIEHNREKLSTLEKEKKKKLEEVTETETYKKAKEILLKFAPNELNTPLKSKTQVPTFSETPRRTPSQNATPRFNSGELRRRVVPTPSQPQNTQFGLHTPHHVTPGVRLNNQSMNSSFASGVRSPTSPNIRSSLPRPVLPHERTLIDRLVDYLVGDGPSNRYALICRQCEYHNGMALKEEFEYFAYRCCYCGFWNPAKKQKPSAPKLDFDNNSATPSSTSGITSSVDDEKINLGESETCTQSDTDSDIEVVERPGESSETPEAELKTESKLKTELEPQTEQEAELTELLKENESEIQT